MIAINSNDNGNRNVSNERKKMIIKLFNENEIIMAKSERKRNDENNEKRRKRNNENERK